ncbi:hypothetical protein K461DRAFT_274957 [Myriangium duriaei CBS 260.36]|uniref:Autophagy-related protein 14 n=1 Tax=Myriangium duriaei CBS 260.36 TaxID=1168546 RepID=A0A9P4J6Q9_9PEZI|nr:hypothetical protein K461DRAFT_274957 [Myriangium duriaei CBS 260.36]
MECGICSKKFGKQRQPNCPSCSRATAYNLRVEQATSLLDKEKLHRIIQTVLQPPSQLRASQISSPSQVVELTESARKLEIEKHKYHILAVDTRLEAIKEQQDLLRQQIVDARKENATRKSEHHKKREEIQAARLKLHNVHSAQLNQIRSDCKRSAHRLEKVQKHTIQGRQKLCMETAVLSGLRRKRGRTRNGVSSSDAVSIGKMSIPDLRELNTVHPDVINASLAHITRLLATTSHYLGIRLPAEIIPPHADFPQPAIYSLQSSYGNKTGKLRHLSIAKPLPLLAKEESPIYNLFVDGLVLLAYDIAWLCRTQGLINITTWEDLCAIGPNLYNLFLGEQSHVYSSNTNSDSQLKNGANLPRLGEFSHANTSADVTNHQVTNLLSRWEMPSLAQIQDKVKSYLLTEISGAEWEMLDEKEWEEEREDERAVLVGGARWSLAAGAASRMGVSYMTTAQDPEDATQLKDESGKGWMKLKVRSGEGKE